MNYEEKYKQALEGIQEILSSGSDSIKLSRLKLRLQPFFQELKEQNKNEIIREALINGFSHYDAEEYCNVKIIYILDWLRKQKFTEEDVKNAYLRGKKDGLNEQLPSGFYFVDENGKKYFSKEFRYEDMKVKVKV